MSGREDRHLEFRCKMSDWQTEWTQRRRGKLLSGLDLPAMVGVEIGPLTNPIVTRECANVFYVDHATTEELRIKFAKDPNVDVEKIVDVHAVWGTNTLSAALAKKGRAFDYVVASHVVEHVPDLISWLSEVAEVLHEGGTLRLAVPDRRYTFDLLRRESELADVLDAYLRKTRVPLPRAILDFKLNWRKVDCTAAWNGTIVRSELTNKFTREHAIEQAQDTIANGAYHDVHCWVFTPKSFASLFYQLAEMDLINFACEHHFDTLRNEIEFFVVLKKTSDKPYMLASWKNMSESVADNELSAIERDLEQTKEKLKEAEDRANQLEASTCWKITGPIRAAVDALKQ